MNKPTAKRGTSRTPARRAYPSGEYKPATETRVDMFQRDIDMIEKIKNTNLTNGDQEYLIGALYKLNRLEKDNYQWED
jgi:hypothetical protein